MNKQNISCIDLIIKYRVKRGFTQDECAKIINRSRSGYNEIEHKHARLSADDFIKLVEFLDIDIKEWYSLNEIPKVSTQSNMNDILITICTLRKSNNLTTKEMGKVLNMSQQNYARIEKGQLRLTVDLFLKICDYFKINPASFFQNSDNYNIEVSNNEYNEIKKTLGLLCEKFK